MNSNTGQISQTIIYQRLEVSKISLGRDKCQVILETINFFINTLNIFKVSYKLRKRVIYVSVYGRAEREMGEKRNPDVLYTMRK